MLIKRLVTGAVPGSSILNKFRQSSIQKEHVCLACEQAPVGDSRVQSRANGMSRERSGEEGVRRGACRHSIDAAVP